MEPTGDAEKKEAKEQRTTVNGVGDERGRLQLSIVRETVFRLYFHVFSFLSELYTI